MRDVHARGLEEMSVQDIYAGRDDLRAQEAVNHRRGKNEVLAAGYATEDPSTKLLSLTAVAHKCLE
jgi:hypothetical protein